MRSGGDCKSGGGLWNGGNHFLESQGRDFLLCFHLRGASAGSRRQAQQNDRYNIVFSFTKSTSCTFLITTRYIFLDEMIMDTFRIVTTAALPMEDLDIEWNRWGYRSDQVPNSPFEKVDHNDCIISRANFVFILLICRDFLDLSINFNCHIDFS